MDLSDIARAGAEKILMFWAVGAAFWRWIPDYQIICDKIAPAKKMLDLIGEAPELVNYEKILEDNIQSLDNTTETLLCVEKDVQQELEMLEFQTNKKRKRVVVNWLKNVAAKYEEARNVGLEMGRTRAFLRFLFRAWLKRCVEEKKKEVSELLGQRRDFLELVCSARHLTQEKLVTSALVGRVTAERKEEIWRQLTSQEVTILGVEGDQGMGKSEIMMHIYNQILDNPDLFDSAFYVRVKEGYGVRELQAAIGGELKLQGLQDENAEHRRAYRIHEALKKAKRFFLILDGLMSDYKLEHVGIPIGEEDGKLVVIARSKRVCWRMLCQPVLKLDELPYEDSRELFMETLKSLTDLSPDIEEVADEIIRKCNGVPSTIIEASKALRGAGDISEWRTKLSELENGISV